VLACRIESAQPEQPGAPPGGRYAIFLAPESRRLDEAVRYQYASKPVMQERLVPALMEHDHPSTHGRGGPPPSRRCERTRALMRSAAKSTSGVTKISHLIFSRGPASCCRSRFSLQTIAFPFTTWRSPAFAVPISPRRDKDGPAPTMKSATPGSADRSGARTTAP